MGIRKAKVTRYRWFPVALTGSILVLKRACAFPVGLPLLPPTKLAVCGFNGPEVDQLKWPTYNGIPPPRTLSHRTMNRKTMDVTVCVNPQVDADNSVSCVDLKGQDVVNNGRQPRGYREYPHRKGHCRCCCCSVAVCVGPEVDADNHVSCVDLTGLAVANSGRRCCSCCCSVCGPPKRRRQQSVLRQGQKVGKFRLIIH